jgi:hypothetical protein
MSIVIRSDFVVYGYARERADRFGNEGTYYYIGKGTPKRPYSRNRFVERPKRDSNIHILQKKLDEKTAYFYEKFFISFYGRVDTRTGWGVLLNSTNGGGGTSGYKWTSGNLSKISGANHHKSKVGNWCHCEVGFVGSKTAPELEKMFPEHGIKATSLRELANGRSKVYMGWVFIPENEVNSGLDGEDLIKKFPPGYAKQIIKDHKNAKFFSKIGASNNNYKSRNWCHINHGLVVNKSAKDVASIYTDTGASSSGLSKTALGKTRYHQGWIYVPEELIDKNLSLEELKLVIGPNYARDKIESFKLESIKNNPGCRRVGELNHMFGKVKELHPSYGSKRTGETCSKISQKARARFARRDWEHPIHGVVRGVLYCELIEMFPDQNLSQGNLSSVASGSRSQHKGWRFLNMSDDQ